MRSAMVRRFFTFRVTTDNTRPPLIRLSGQRPSHEAKAAALGNLRKSGPHFSQQRVSSQATHTRDCGQVNAEDAIQLRAQIEARLISSRLVMDLWAWIKASGRREDCWEGPAGAAQSRYHKQRSIVDTGDRLAGTAAE